MPISQIELKATYELESGREAVPLKEFSSPIDGSPQVEIEVHWNGNVKFEELPKADFMEITVRKLKDAPQNF